MSALAVRATAPGLSPVVTLRLLAASTPEPKGTFIDDEYEQLVLPLEWIRAVRDHPPAPPKPKAPQPTELPDPRPWAARIGVAAFEILLGRRPASQLAKHIDARVAASLASHATQYELQRRRRGNQPVRQPQLSSVQAFRPHSEAAEVTLVMHDGDRFRAVAMRLDAHGTKWIVTAFHIL